MRHLLSTIALVCLAGFPGHADPMDDALYVVDQTVTRDQFETAFASMSELMVGSFQNEFSKEGKTVSTDAARVLSQLLSSNMVDGLISEMREPLAAAYVENMSAHALADLRAFLETDSGQEFAASTNAIMRESVKIGEELAVTVVGPAVEAMQNDIRNERWPEGTLKSTQAELRELYGLPPVSDMPPER